MKHMCIGGTSSKFVFIVHVQNREARTRSSVSGLKLLHLFRYSCVQVFSRRPSACIREVLCAEIGIR